MCFFLYYLEELYNRRRDGGDGSIVAALLDTKIIFVYHIHRYRSGASTFEHTILKGPPESIKKKPVKGYFSKGPKQNLSRMLTVKAVFPS